MVARTRHARCGHFHAVSAFVTRDTSDGRLANILKLSLAAKYRQW
jgi:hypothetical protein